MAEHNSQDTKSPVPPRRGARPFVGPAGAPGQPLPLLRTTPMPRPAGAPFAPLPIARTTLGTAARPAAPVPAQAPVADAMGHVGAVSAMVPAPAPAIERSPLNPALMEQPTEWANARRDAGAVIDAVDAGSTPSAESIDELPAQGTESSPYDQFAAFDAAWHDDATVDDPEPQAATSPPLDLPSLGSGDAHLPWAGDVTGLAELPPGPEASGPSWLMDDTETAPAAADDTTAPTERGIESFPLAAAPTDEENAPAIDASQDASWNDVTVMPSADAIVADAMETPRFAADAPAPDADMDVLARDWPDPLLAEYAPYVPTPAIGASAIASSAVPLDAEAPTEMSSDAVPGYDGRQDLEASAPEPTLTEDPHEIRVAATLERLAERVRHGEIDVSSVAPGGPDAAVLAAVLAALLGGGRSSSR